MGLARLAQQVGVAVVNNWAWYQYSYKHARDYVNDIHEGLVFEHAIMFTQRPRAAARSTHP